MSVPQEESVVFVVFLDDKIVGFQKKEDDAHEALKRLALKKQAELKGEWVEVSLQEEKNQNSIAIVVQQLGRVYNSASSPVHLVRFERITCLSASDIEKLPLQTKPESESEPESEPEDSESEYEPSSDSSGYSD